MSTPIHACEVYKAAKGDEKAYTFLLEAMKYNLTCGHWTQMGCMHDPPCEEPTNAQIDALNERYQKDIEEWQKTRKKS